MVLPDIAGTVASMTESDPSVESERASHDTPGKPGQRHEVGKAFGCSVRSKQALLRFRSVRSREAVSAFNFFGSIGAMVGV